MAPKKPVEKVTLRDQDVSWGFGDDAVEDDSGDDVGDVIAEARDLKEAGKLTEKQDKALEKLEKKVLKMAHLRDEVRCRTNFEFVRLGELQNKICICVLM